jgi:FkbM family methyltransferase
MFNNCNPNTNGEIAFHSKLPKNLVIFDVGSRNDSWFLSYSGFVHYFDPDPNFIDELRSRPDNKNQKSAFNPFGLSDEAGLFSYYPKHQSFINRINSTGNDDSRNLIYLELRTAKEYILNQGIEHIHFLKIDTEGYEWKVMMGFSDCLDRVGFMQFEYGGTFQDTSTKLSSVVEWLRYKNFIKFYYLSSKGLIEINDFRDHYQYCNIICARAGGLLQKPPLLAND